MANVPISTWEYNVISNEYAAFERALLVLMDERGVDGMTLGNVYIYRADDGHIGAWFVDEQGVKQPPVDYSLADYGIFAPVPRFISGR